MTEGAESKMSAESRTLVPQKSPIRPVHPGKELLDDGRDTIHRRIDICIYIYIYGTTVVEDSNKGKEKESRMLIYAY